MIPSDRVQSVSTLPVELGLHAFQENIYLSFLTARVFKGGPRTSIPSQDSQSWIYSAIAEHPTSVASTGAHCLAAAYFGRMHGFDPTAMKRGVLHYTQAIRLLQKNIQDPTACYKSANVAGAILLCLYELVSVTRKLAWRWHAAAVGRLIEIGGVERYRVPLQRKYLVIGRLPVIVQALSLRKRTFLEQEEWKTVPWADDPASKNSFDYLVDILANLPGLLEDGAAADTPKRFRNFRERLIGHFRDLFVWRWNWECSNPASTTEVPTYSNVPFSGDGNRVPLYETVISYKHFQRAREIMLYNSTLLIAMRLAKSWFAEPLPVALSAFPASERPRPSNPLILPHEKLTSADIAREMCRSIEYHFQEPHAQAGPMTLVLPIRVCLPEFQEGQGEQDWLTAMLRRIADTCGFEISRPPQEFKKMQGWPIRK